MKPVFETTGTCYSFGAFNSAGMDAFPQKRKRRRGAM